jgi:hypothetical protein
MTKGGWVSDDLGDVAFSVSGMWWTACLCLDMYQCFVFRLAHVAAWKRMGSMSDLPALIEQIVMDIATQTFQLEDLRLRLFLNWLMDHSSQMKVSLGNLDAGLRCADMEERFQSALKTWLQSLPAQGVLWEYRVITEEIGWWHDLDSLRLKMIVRSDVEE